MLSRKLLRLSGTAGIASALCSLGGAAVVVAATLVPAIPALAYGILFMAANVMIVFLLMGIYGCQAEESGGQGLAGFAVAVIGLMLAMARFFNPLGWLLFLMGILMLTLASERTRKLPQGGMWLWVFATLLAIVVPYAGIWLLSAALVPLFSASAKLWIGSGLRALAGSTQAATPPAFVDDRRSD